ncbi:MAG: FAD-dependent oxidoreductase, partial [Bacteroidales bacterium]|nr:FAD-dependent oxidoreductase [Bacteroidales bacterium]
MEQKLAIYICEGCRIGAAVDTSQLCTKMDGELKPALCRSHAALCSPDGERMIARDIDAEGISGCLIAGCGAGTKDELFRFDGGVQTERVNIRELVAWTMEPGEEDTLMAAEDYIRMGYAGLKQLSGVTPFILENISEELLVVGGGVAGLKAAIDGAGAGYTVHLVEKAEALGGWALQWKQQIPFDRPFGELRDPVVHELVQHVEEHERIHIHLATSIERIDGEPGAFEVQLNGGVQETLRVGSIVTASGWKPYRPEKGSFYGLGEVAGVTTSVGFEAEVLENALPVMDSVLFLQCAGSRDENHLPYCSSVCCGVSLKQAKYVRDRYPDAVVYIVYKDIRTPGFMEDFYKEMQDDTGIVFIKGEVNGVARNGGKIAVQISDRLLGEELSAMVDRVV